MGLPKTPFLRAEVLRSTAVGIQCRSLEARQSAPREVAATNAGVVGGIRAMSTWRLRPYAAAGAVTMAPLSQLSAGFSKVGLSLLVLPWKALPMALVVAPVVWAVPAAYRMIFQNSMRHTTASVFTGILYLVLAFMPVPCFENLFSEPTFYGIALLDLLHVHLLPRGHAPRLYVHALRGALHRPTDPARLRIHAYVRNEELPLLVSRLRWMKLLETAVITSCRHAGINSAPLCV